MSPAVIAPVGGTGAGEGGAGGSEVAAVVTPLRTTAVFATQAVFPAPSPRSGSGSVMGSRSGARMWSPEKCSGNNEGKLLAANAIELSDRLRAGYAKKAAELSDAQRKAMEKFIELSDDLAKQSDPREAVKKVKAWNAENRALAKLLGITTVFSNSPASALERINRAVVE